MSNWNHAMCDECWNWAHPGRVPCRVTRIYRFVAFLGLRCPGRPPKKPCCFCGKLTRSGIYVRGNPETTPCHGEHD